MVTAQFGSDPSKFTVCVYGHVDVQPAKLEDGWRTDPYNLTDLNGRKISTNKELLEHRPTLLGVSLTKTSWF